MMRALLFVLLAVATPSLGSEPVLVGTVEYIVDGDTLDVKLDSGTIRVRMHGIDTPEEGQTFYKEAKQSLARLVFRKTVELQPVGQSSYERMVARVYLKGTDINAAQIKSGMAYAETRFLKQVEDGATYCAFEGAARSLKRGLWALPWDDRIAPWEWRKKSQLDEFTDFADETTEDCIAAIGEQRE